jgi:hypothetical protein
MDVFNIAQFSFGLAKRYLYNFFVLLAQSLNKKNSCENHNSYNKGPNPTGHAFLESLVNFVSTQKVSKYPLTNWNGGCLPKIPKFHLWNS